MNRTNTAHAKDAVLTQAFVERHYGFLGSFKLHCHALGWDLFRSPANVVLAPLFLLVRLAALILRGVGFKRLSSWLSSRRVFFRSSVSRAVETSIWTEVMEERCEPLHQTTPHQKRLVEEYADVRNAISEIFTSVMFLCVGLIVFETATPGVVSMAPIVSDVARTTAASESFLFGQRLGSIWYGVFPPEVPLWFVVSIGFTLAAGASIVTAFAGVIADPLQAVTGVHKRRIMRLIRAVDENFEDPPKLAREHILARFSDLSDAGVSLVRTFRP